MKQIERKKKKGHAYDTTLESETHLITTMTHYYILKIEINIDHWGAKFSDGFG